MNNIVSYALFSNHPEYGHRELYWQCIPAVVLAHHVFFPEWEMRVHHDSSVDRPCGDLLRKYAAEGLVTLKYVEENVATCRSMLWRLLPLWDEGAGYVICRDMDSLPTAKDRAAVNEFTSSGRAIHELGDNQSHTGLMGGMVGFYAKTCVEGLRDAGISSWDDFVKIGDTETEFPMHVPSGGPDQILMNRVFPTLFRDSMLIVNLMGKPHGQEAHIFGKELADVSASLMPCLGAPGFDVANALHALRGRVSPEISSALARAES